MNSAIPSPLEELGLVIGGEDFAGWTLDDYVIPRLASGLIFAEEIDLSHPAMKQLPDSLGDGVVGEIMDDWFTFDAARRHAGLGGLCLPG